jgi:hypothetical protein
VRNKLWISLFILVVLGLHAVPVLFYQGVRQTRWPFLVWAMYARSYPPGPILVSVRKIYGTTAAGRPLDINAKVAGLSGPAFRNAYGVPLDNGDSTAARELLDRLNRDRRDPVVALRVETTQYRLADPGMVVDTLPAKLF